MSLWQHQVSLLFHVSCVLMLIIYSASGIVASSNFMDWLS